MRVVSAFGFDASFEDEEVFLQHGSGVDAEFGFDGFDFRGNFFVDECSVASVLDGDD